MDAHKVVGVLLVTEAELHLMSDRVTRLYPLNGDDEAFAELLRAIDAIDSALPRVSRSPDPN